jgi:hypothetical protein
MSLDHENSREALWLELLFEAEQEAKEGDGRALRALHRLRARIEPHRLPVVPHVDDGN